MANHITLEQIAQSALGDQEKYTTHEFTRLLGYAQRGLKELTYDVLGETKVVILNVDSELRVDLPDDFVDYSYIGTIDSDYQLSPLAVNGKIPVNGSSNKKTRINDNTEDVAFTHYGLGGGQNRNGYYAPQIDRTNWQIIFASTEVGKTIYIEYIGDGSNANLQSVVHPYAEEALISYVYWKSIQRKRRVPLQEKEIARRDYYNEKRLARARICSFTKEELLTHIRKGYKQAPTV